MVIVIIDSISFKIMRGRNMNTLNIRALTLSLGMTWGLGILFLGWVSIFGWGIDVVDVLSSFYLGYNATFVGAIIGAIWAFVDGAITGLFIGFFYKLFANHKKGKKRATKGSVPKRRKRR